MYQISKLFSFESAHCLTGLPEEHPCSRLHGHSYKAIFTFESLELNAVGFIIDYRELDSIKKWIDETLDHRVLNEVFPDLNPTAENLAKQFYAFFRHQYWQLKSVTVKETDKTSATYTP